jgi:tRNA A-37 threonylcarbamoyl transferase component Bud32
MRPITPLGQILIDVLGTRASLIKSDPPIPSSQESPNDSRPSLRKTSAIPKDNLFAGIAGLIIKRLDENQTPNDPPKENHSVNDDQCLDLENLVEDVSVWDDQVLENLRLNQSDPGVYFRNEDDPLGYYYEEERQFKFGVEDFEYLKVLGKGAFGKVFLVRRRKTKDLYAMKVIQIEKVLTKEQIANLVNERDVFSIVHSELCVNA